MLKQEFNDQFTAFKVKSFGIYVQKLINSKYGTELNDRSDKINPDYAFLQMELLEVIEEANMNRKPFDILVLPCYITQMQIDEMLSLIKNQLV